MAETINFDNKKINKTIEIKRKTPTDAYLKYAPKAALPDRGDRNVLIFTDTLEFYCGKGSNQPLQRLSDIVVIANTESLPEIGLEQKLYVTTDEKALYFWDGSTFQAVTSGSNDSVIKDIIGDFISNPSLLTELHKIDSNILAAIIKLNSKVQATAEAIKVVNKDIVFIIPRVGLGAQKTELLFPYSGKIEKIFVNLPSDTSITEKLTIEVECLRAGFWERVDEITICPGQSTANKQVLPNFLINMEPVRLNVTSCQEDLSNLNVIVSALATIKID